MLRFQNGFQFWTQGVSLELWYKFHENQKKQKSFTILQNKKYPTFKKSNLNISPLDPKIFFKHFIGHPIGHLCKKFQIFLLKNKGATGLQNDPLSFLHAKFAKYAMLPLFSFSSDTETVGRAR
jgi:hypothetical protein